jgi:hypothetical protein
MIAISTGYATTKYMLVWSLANVEIYTQAFSLITANSHKPFGLLSLMSSGIS